MCPALTLEGVSHRYGELEVLADIDLTVAAGERIAVVGPSGSGKTTLLELICGLLVPSGGVIRGPRATLMPQRDLLLPWLSALDNAGLALRVGGLSRGAARARAAPLMERLGLSGFEDTVPSRLSGGMRQRVALVRSLLAPGELIALDEPFAALDAITRSELQRWFTTALDAEPRSVVLVTHDVEEAVLLGNRVIVLGPRPARVLAEVTILLPHPRRATDPAVQSLRAEILDVLGGAR